MMEGWTKQQTYEYCRILYARKLSLKAVLGSDKAVGLLSHVQIRLEMALDRFNNHFK